METKFTPNFFWLSRIGSINMYYESKSLSNNLANKNTDDSQ